MCSLQENVFKGANPANRAAQEGVRGVGVSLLSTKEKQVGQQREMFHPLLELHGLKRSEQGMRGGEWPEVYGRRGLTRRNNSGGQQLRSHLAPRRPCWSRPGQLVRPLSSQRTLSNLFYFLFCFLACKMEIAMAISLSCTQD